MKLNIVFKSKEKLSIPYELIADIESDIKRIQEEKECDRKSYLLRDDYGSLTYLIDLQSIDYIFVSGRKG